MVRASKTPSRGGRPSAAAAKRLGDTILNVATDLFLTQGYGATTIDAIAAKAGIAKRTFYARYPDKAALFGAVIHRLVEKMRPAHDETLFEGPSLEAILLQLARFVLPAALLPHSLALQRIMLAEAIRFPELAQLLDTHGARAEAIRRIADLLQAHRTLSRAQAEFGAEQFLNLITNVPQRRAMGLGLPMTDAECATWITQSVNLFVGGFLHNHIET